MGWSSRQRTPSISKIRAWMSCAVFDPIVGLQKVLIIFPPPCDRSAGRGEVSDTTLFTVHFNRGKFHHLIHKAIVDSALGVQVEIPVRVLLDCIDTLPGMFG